MEIKKPNIVLFLVDQLRRDALGCYGNTICKTPNIDQLSKEGIKFDNAFTTSPVCSPSRASLMTGLYPHNHGVMVNTHIAPAWSRGLDLKTPTFSRILKEKRYAVDYVGKWHVHEDLGPEKYGFTRHIIPEFKSDVLPGTEITIEFPKENFTVAGTCANPKEETETWKCAEEGISIIREHAKNKKPFFLRIDGVDPHFPNIPPEPYDSMYDPKDIPPWPNFEETFKNKPASHLRKHKEWNLEKKDWDWWSKVVAKYYGTISFIDECVGRVLNTIKECGIEDNTIFIFSTDHGDATGSHKHIEKAGTMYDEIFHIPLIIKTPPSWKNSNRQVSSFVRLMDLMPTFVELAGAKAPQNIDACSLIPFLKGKTPDNWPDSVYCEHHGEVWGYQSQRMVRTNNWKYVYSPSDFDELYNLKDDPYEMKNLISDSSYKDILKEMKARLIGWNDYTNDMFQWGWVKWNFPDPVLPLEITSSNMPLTKKNSN
jgi:arylsulfatase A-like enzyme